GRPSSSSASIPRSRTRFRSEPGVPTVEVVVPDLGDFSDVEIVDVLVKPGDEVSPEDPLVTLETDKATMDVPSPAAGRVAELKIAVGDRVSTGDPLLSLETDGAREPA